MNYSFLLPYSTVHEYNRCMRNAVDGRCDADAQKLVEETVITALKQSFGYCQQLPSVPTSNCQRTFSESKGFATGTLGENGYGDGNGQDRERPYGFLLHAIVLFVMVLTWPRILDLDCWLQKKWWGWTLNNETLISDYHGSGKGCPALKNLLWFDERVLENRKEVWTRNDGFKINVGEIGVFFFQESYLEWWLETTKAVHWWGCGSIRLFCLDKVPVRTFFENRVFEVEFWCQTRRATDKPENAD